MSDPRMSLTLKDMPKWPSPEKRLPLRGETRDHYDDGTIVHRLEKSMKEDDRDKG